MCQKTIDARSYPHQALDEIRISVVHRVVAGESPDVVVARLGMNHCTLTEHRARYASTTKTTQHCGNKPGFLKTMAEYSLKNSEGHDEFQSYLDACCS